MVLSRTPEAFFQDCVVNDQSAFTNYIYSMIAASILEYMLINHHCHMLSRNSKETVWTQNRGVCMRIFWCQHPRHCVRHPYHCLPNSRTLHLDFLDFPRPNSFSRTFQVVKILQTQSQDFPGGMGTLFLSVNQTKFLLWVFEFNQTSELLVLQKSVLYNILTLLLLHGYSNDPKSISVSQTEHLSWDLQKNSLKPVSIMKDFYRTVLCIRGTSHGPVSVCYKLVFY